MTYSFVMTAFTSVAVTAATLVSGVMLARLLGPDARGAYGAAQFWAQFAVSLGTFSLYEAAVVRLRGSGETGASQLPSLLVAAGCLSIGCFALVSLAHLAGIVRVPDVSTTTFLAFALAAQVIGHYSLSFIAVESVGLRFGRLNLDRVASPVLFTAACFALYIADIASVPAILCVFALAHLPVLILRFWRLRASLRGRVDTAFLRPTAALGLRFHASTTLGLVASEADRLIVVSLWSEDLFGYYFVAVSATGAGFALLASSLRIVLLPSLAGMEPDGRRPSVERLLRVTLSGCVLSASALYIAAPTLVPLIYGSDFAPAATYVQGLLFPMMLLPCISVVGICNRSAERGWPSVEMGLVSLLAFVGGHAATGLATAPDLFATMALANVLSILSGMRHLADHGDIRWSHAVLPFPSDVRFMRHQLSQLLRHRRAAYVRWPHSRARVLVIHSQARHNYALPAAFAEAGMLERFYTDVCAGRGIGRAAEAARAIPMPKQLAAARDRLVGRRPPARVLERTSTDDLEALRYEAERRWAKDDVDRFRALHRHHRRRDRRMVRKGLGRATHVFNVLGEGGDLLDIARSRGVTVLTDIVIALSFDTIVRREYQAFPDWGPAPVDRQAAIGGGCHPAEHLLRTTDVFVCPSRFVADDLVANWGVARTATRIVPYAISDAWLSLTPRPVPGRVLFVGSADRHKGIHYLAMAVDRLQEQGRRYEFRVAGDVAPEVRDKPVCRPLSFLGRVPRARIADEFATADVLVLPTLAEGSASVTYEALAAGVPVITTHAAGSVVRHDVDGLIVLERDPDALAAAIEAIVEDRARRDAMAAAARAHATDYSWSRYRERLFQSIDLPMVQEPRS